MFLLFVREYIMQMMDIAVQLKYLKVGMPDFFIVHFMLNSLAQQYEPFKISYNKHKEKGQLLKRPCVFKRKEDW